MKLFDDVDRRRGGQIRSNSPVAKLALCHGIGYQQMAKETDISYSILKRLSIRKYTVTVELARRIADRYGCSIEYVMERDPGYVTGNRKGHLERLQWEPYKLSDTPAGVAEEIGMDATERDAALIAALKDCAKLIDYSLPQGDEEKAALGDVCTWYAPKKYSDEELKKMRPEVLQAFKRASEMHQLWMKVPPIVKNKQHGNLRRHFFYSFFTHLPTLKVKTHYTLMKSLDALARDARGHPQAPLIRKRIIKAHFDIRRAYGL